MGIKSHFEPSFNAVKSGWGQFRKTIVIGPQEDEAIFNELRNRVLQIFVVCALSLGILILIPTSIIIIESTRAWVAAYYALIYCIFAIFMLTPSISYKVKAYCILTTLLAVGIQIMLTMGVVSSGPAWLFAFAIMAGTLLGIKAAIMAIIFNAAVLIAMGWMHHAGLIASQDSFISVDRAVLAGVGFIFLNALSAFSIAGLHIGFASAMAQAQRAQKELSIESELRQQTSGHLRESEDKYRLLADNISDILWSLDMDLNITYANPAAEVLLGWTTEDLKRLHLEDLLTAVSLEKALKVFANNLAVLENIGDFTQSDTLVLDIRCKDGTTVSTEVRARFIKGEDGKPIGIMGVARDISERLKAQREKELLQEKLAQSKRMEALGLLAGGVAHDLNNVLSGMVSYPDLLLFDMPESNPMRKPLEMIRHTGNKAAAIVQDLLAMTRRGVRTLGAVNLNDAVEEYLSSPEFSELKKRHPNVKVETQLAGDLMTIKGSSMHLRKTLMNLALNAAEAQPDGGRIAIRTQNCHLDQPSTTIEQMPPGDYARLTISDQGIGIAQEDLKHIFEPFFTRKIMGRSGTGLGMAVVWGTVQDHGGFISVQSQEGQGSTFDLYFPIARDAVPPAQDKDTVDNLLGSWQTILVVDDVAEQREIAVQILKRLRYRPLTANSGEEAIRIFSQLSGSTIDAVILDMIMPLGLDGLDTYRGILEIAPNTKAIITSGYSETERVREALHLGAGAYLKKPYMIQEIGVALKKLLVERNAKVDKVANG